jgi:molybdopterin-guanine dinucleotide biosynthesis protein A
VAETREPEIGILVGGRGLRMGGVAKSNLPIGGRTILERTLDVCRTATLTATARPVPIWLVGESSAYVASGVSRLPDDPSGIGPLGGLRALLRELAPRGAVALVLAGDLPFVTAELLDRLFHDAPGAAALAPRDSEGRWQPLFARYLPEVLLPEIEHALQQGRRSLQYLFERLADRASRLELSAAEERALRDWDRPSDMIAECPDGPV